MKKIKVYALPSHQEKDRTSGVDYARVIQPMTYLNGYEKDGYTFEVKIYDIHAEDQDNWVQIAEEYDIVFLNYTVMDWAYAAMGAPLRYHNKKIVFDLDDSIWHIQKDNITYASMADLNASRIVSCIIDDVDHVTTTNGYLRNVIVDKTYSNHGKITVIPNMIDLTRYKKTFPPKDRQTVTILHYGATGHTFDLSHKPFVEGVDRIMKEYPNVQFKMVGTFVQELRYKWGQRCHNEFGDRDIYKWIDEKFPEFMEEADIVVAPLVDTIYNRGKSDIKFIEMASAKKAGVFSNTRPYKESVQHGKTGYLADTANEWYESLKELMDIKKRKEIGTNAYNYVKKERQIQDHIDKYAQVIINVLTK